MHKNSQRACSRQAGGQDSLPIALPRSPARAAVRRVLQLGKNVLHASAGLNSAAQAQRMYLSKWRNDDPGEVQQHKTALLRGRWPEVAPETILSHSKETAYVRALFAGTVERAGAHKGAGGVTPLAANHDAVGQILVAIWICNVNTAIYYGIRQYKNTTETNRRCMKKTKHHKSLETNCPDRRTLRCHRTRAGAQAKACPAA